VDAKKLLEDLMDFDKDNIPDKANRSSARKWPTEVGIYCAGFKI
jgi:hypothetical protein